MPRPRPVIGVMILLYLVPTAGALGRKGSCRAHAIWYLMSVRTEYYAITTMKNIDKEALRKNLLPGRSKDEQTTPVGKRGHNPDAIQLLEYISRRHFVPLA